jgi:hypothetical protein
MTSGAPKPDTAVPNWSGSVPEQAGRGLISAGICRVAAFVMVGGLQLAAGAIDVWLVSKDRFLSR